jgi:hypothetical protein
LLRFLPSSETDLVTFADDDDWLKVVEDEWFAVMTLPACDRLKLEEVVGGSCTELFAAVAVFWIKELVPDWEPVMVDAAMALDDSLDEAVLWSDGEELSSTCFVDVLSVDQLLGFAVSN